MSRSNSSLNVASRSAAITALGESEFDILVIGGGINGVGIALDAASRGLSVALVESGDFASGTSSKSSKLIHGGLRYLEQYDFRLVREALYERELMVTTLSPHLVKPVSFLYPLHEKLIERTYVGAGMALYDALRGFKRALPWHKHLSQKKVSEIAPSLRLDVITGGFQYFDAQVDDARHTMSIARTAAKYGAVITTRTRCEEVIKNGKRVVGAKIRDLLSDEVIEVRAKATIMASGVWSDQLHEKFGLKAGYKVRMSKGSHIVVPKSAINSQSGVIIKTDVSVLFIIPWGEQWIVGTTDTDYQESKEEPLASSDDVSYIINQANRVLEPKLRRDQVVGVFAGLRPLVSTDPDSPTTTLSREHVVDSPTPGFVSIAGGKYTTYRVMSEDAVDEAVNHLRRIVPDSTTENLAIIGAEGYSVLINKIPKLAKEYGLSEETIRHLLDRYGSLFDEVLAPAKEDTSLLEPLIEGLLYIKAEALYAITHEAALSIDDLLSRRTRIAFEASDSGLSITSYLGELLGNFAGLGKKEITKSITEYEQIIMRQKKNLEKATQMESKVG
ncbi:MAG TPA: glycerol-3-phosphate dehydrogenase [Candidatus Nanopelagicaceae bacterium]|nr:glycerol-3-phosphate dehydrogenase [Candidatus Nanopelagicaceae bacterium]